MRKNCICTKCITLSIDGFALFALLHTKLVIIGFTWTERQRVGCTLEQLLRTIGKCSFEQLATWEWQWRLCLTIVMHRKELPRTYVFSTFSALLINLTWIWLRQVYVFSQRKTLNGFPFTSLSATVSFVFSLSYCCKSSFSFICQRHLLLLFGTSQINSFLEWTSRQCLTEITNSNSLLKLLITLPKCIVSQDP